MDAPHIYTILLDRGTEMFNLEPLLSHVQNISQFVITSKKFGTYRECAENASNLMSIMAFLTEQASGRKQVIVSKLNPAYDSALTDEEKLTAVVGWDTGTVLKFYIADAEKFKNEKTIKFTISCSIDVAPEVFATANILSPAMVQ